MSHAPYSSTSSGQAAQQQQHAAGQGGHAHLVNSSAGLSAGAAGSNNAAPQTQKEYKPSLQGVRIKARKRETAAKSKHEPEAFRDALYRHLEGAVDESTGKVDFDAVASKLDLAGNQLDYRRYGDPTLFEILFVGGILAPGGVFVEDGAPLSPFSIVTAPSAEPSVIRKYVDVLNKLVRRYKYLQKAAEDTTVSLFQYLNKWNAEDVQKIATATGQLAALNLIGFNVLEVLLKEHLVKTGLSLQFITQVFKVYMSDGQQSVEQLFNNLKRADLNDILDFFPPSMKSEQDLVKHFSSQKNFSSSGNGATTPGPNWGSSVSDFYVRKQTAGVKEDIAAHLKELAAAEDGPNVVEIQTYLADVLKTHPTLENDWVGVVWSSLMGTIDWGRPDQVEQQALKEIQRYEKVLGQLGNSPKNELKLLQAIQVYCYEETKLMKSFPKIVQLLYKNDVVSDQAILYWFNKGSKPNGRKTFLAGMETFVAWLRKQQEEEESEEED